MIPSGDRKLAETGHPGFIDLCFLSRMPGRIILGGAVAALPAGVAERARHWVKRYKAIRHLLVKDYYRLLAQPQSDADWDAGQFCDGSRAGVVFVFRDSGYIPRQLLYLRSVDAQKKYRFKDEANGAEQVISGEQLLAGGFCVDLPPNSARLYSYRAL